MGKKLSRKITKRSSRRMYKRKSKRMYKRKSRRMNKNNRSIKGGSSFPPPPTVPALTLEDFCSMEKAIKKLKSVNNVGSYMFVKKSYDTKFSLIELASSNPVEFINIDFEDSDLTKKYFPAGNFIKYDNNKYFIFKYITNKGLNKGLNELLKKIKEKNSNMKLTKLLGKEYCNIN